MKILLLGSTGRTGKHVLEQAIERGHLVHIIVRDRNKVHLSHPNIQVTEGNPSDETILEKAMRGCEIIISTLNISRTSDWPWARLRTPKQFLSTVMEKIIRLAPQHGIRRVIFSSAWGVAETRNDIPGWFRWFIENSNIRYPYEDHAVQEKLVEQTDLDWTAVRAAGLTNFKRNKEIQVSFENRPKPNLTISRRNLAMFILDIMEKGAYIKQRPVVSEK